MANTSKWQRAKPAHTRRPDLSQRVLIVLAAVCFLFTVVAVLFGRGIRPGDPFSQSAAIFGSVLLLLPIVFFVAKRSGISASPPFWFVLHALSGFGGICLIAFHVASVSGFSFALIPLAALAFLVIQGFWMRAFLSKRFAKLFARSHRSFGYGPSLVTNKAKIAAIIERKQALLALLDPLANEGTFSPRLTHWITRPVWSLRYEWLVQREAILVGARTRAGIVLAFSRKLHLVAGAIFYAGLLAHVIVMLFFAGYAAKDGEIYWWHFTAWGKS